jgi:hypothetical protein
VMCGVLRAVPAVVVDEFVERTVPGSTAAGARRLSCAGLPAGGG